MPLLEWLKAVLTPLAGTAYEPWVQLLQFLLVVAVTVSAMAWVLTRRFCQVIEAEGSDSFSPSLQKGGPS
jgi:hypothetical protein